jgi:hypothetical protein
VPYVCCNVDFAILVLVLLYRRTGRHSLNWDWKGDIHPDDVEHLVSHYTTALAQSVPYSIEYRLKDVASGGYRFTRSMGSPMFDETGRSV